MNCNYCHKPFVKSTPGHIQLYCSKKCRVNTYETKHRERLNREAREHYHRSRVGLILPTFLCKHCGIKFTGKTLLPRIFCSNRCLKNNWMKTHKEYMRKVVNEWAKRNPEKIRAAGRRSAAKRYPLNRDSIIHTTTMNNIRRRGASGHHTFAEWNEMKKKSNFTCLCCGRKEPEIKITRDHKVPLNKGGTNNISNIQPLCFSCNSSKKTGLNCQMNH